MSVHVKTPRIDVEISGKGSRKVLALILAAYPEAHVLRGRRVEEEDGDETVDVFKTAWWKKMQAEHKPGDSIKVYRHNRRLTLSLLSQATGIAESHLSEMERGKRGIGLITALKLGKALQCDYRRFL